MTTDISAQSPATTDDDVATTAATRQDLVSQRYAPFVVPAYRCDFLQPGATISSTPSWSGSRRCKPQRASPFR